MAQKGNVKKKAGNNKNNHDILGLVLIIVSGVLLLCIVIKPLLGVLSEAVFSVLLGVFGIAAYPILVFFLILGIFLLMRRKFHALSVKTSICVAAISVCALIIFQLASTHDFLNGSFADYIGDTYAAKYSMGGVVLGVFAYGLKALITEVACYIVLSLGIVVAALFLTGVFSRLFGRDARKPVADIAPPPPPPAGMMAPREAQRVIPVLPQSGLYVTTIERSSADISSESGIASQVPVRERSTVSNYSGSPVVSRDRSGAAAAAHFKIYGDSDEIRRQSADEFRRAVMETVTPPPPPPPEFTAAESMPYGVAEPYMRVNMDAANANPDMPRRVDYVGTPDNLHELYFPPKKNIEFNDEGIETIDDLGLKLQEHNDSRVRQDIEIIEGSRTPAGFAPPPVFNTPVPETYEPVEQIIDASAPLSEAVPPAPAVGGADDRFMRAYEEQKTPPARIPPLETDRFKTDGILDAFEERHRYASAANNESFEVDEEEREDILDGSNPVPIVAAADSPAAYTAQTEDPPIPDEILDGLIISSGPAVDLSERHDNVSDLITGEDLSGMYVGTEERAEPAAAPKPAKRQKANAPIENQISFDDAMQEQAQTSVVVPSSAARRYKKYDYSAPPIDLLRIYPKNDTPAEELEANSRILEDVVSRFLKAQVKVIDVVPGPQVTRYEIDVPSGTSVKSIETRSADIAYELAAISGVRVQAPIPGKRAVGIEVPNREKSTVGLRDIVDSTIFKNHKSNIVFAVGKDIGGALVVCDLEKVPHILVAGQTGSGKSVGLNSLIVSLLYKSSPEDLRFILIDPKQVEFSKFRGMPHLLLEKIVSDPNEALNALKWAAKEMERRYTVLQQYKCSKLSEYNAMPDVQSGKISKLPHIVIIIDELANLMQSAVSGDIENKISSIAALARAAGIHLIVATQRPSVDVITGTIKANLTSRIAFKVLDANNSRIIIDGNGAEALAGNGDMLFYPGDTAPKRVQGCFVDNDEILSVVDYVKNKYECDFDDDATKFITSSGGGWGGGGEDSKAALDPLCERIMAHAIKSTQISTSVIQRRFSIGYARAARIMDLMDENGFVGPSKGPNRPRDVLMTVEQYRQMFGHDPDENG